MSDTVPCQNAERMGEFACTNRDQCWEPCGELGNREEFAVPYVPDCGLPASTMVGLIEDGMRFRKLIELGSCDNKCGAGFTVGDRLKAKVSFRYWCEVEEVRELIDSATKNNTLTE